MLFSMGASSANRQDAIAAKNAAKSGDGARLGASLAVLERAAARRVPQSDVTRAVTRKVPALRASGGYVSISAYGNDLAEPARATRLQGTERRHPARHRDIRPRTGRGAARHGGDAGAQVPAPDAGHGARRHGHQPGRSVAALPTWRAREPASMDAASSIGALSDSYDCAPGAFEPGAPFTRAADDIASNDLPRVHVLKDLFDVPNDDCSDEGRAMLQLIHDVAPASPKAFYTAFVSQEDFAAGIRALADAGSEVIVDDVIYFAEPMFEDGIIAQAVDDVYRRGVAYFSSAGNDARLSYESRFRRSGDARPLGSAPRLRGGQRGGRPAKRHGVGGIRHAAVVPVGPAFAVGQWQARREQRSRRVVLRCQRRARSKSAPTIPSSWSARFPGFDANIGGDAVEIPIMVNFSDEDVEVQIGIELFEGPAPNYLKYVWFDLDAGVFTVNEFDTASGTVYGHANAAGAEAVGAAAWYQTEEWGSPLRPQCFPACLNSFSSAGGTPVFFGKNGNRLPVPADPHQAGRDRPGRRQHHVLLLRPELRDSGHHRT